MKRDIDPDLRLFFEGCSADIPLKYGIDISFHIAHETQNKQIEEKIIQKLKSYYSMQIRLKERYLKESYRRTVTYILASLVLIITSIILEGNKLDSILFKTLSTGLDIGGWVFLWEAISFFFFKRHKVYHKGRENRRFINANIYFKYELKTKTSPA